MEFKIKSLADYRFRIKRMNAVEVLAIRTNLIQESIDDSIKFFYDILSRVEVQFKDEWLPVRIGNSVLRPTELESNVDALKEIIDFFIGEYLRLVFTKSTESSS